MDIGYTWKQLLSILAILVTFIAYFPYIRGILQGRIKPHVFSWVIWGATTSIVFLVAVAADGGAGAWPIGVSGAVTIIIAALAWLNRADNSITRIDWVFFIAAMSSLPFWYFTSNPLWAVIILTTVDILGFGPTFRKVYSHPFEEPPLFYSLFMLQYIIVILALESYSLTTVLFPAAIAVACLLIIILILYRRRVLPIKNQVQQ